MKMTSDTSISINKTLAGADLGNTFEVFALAASEVWIPGLRAFVKYDLIVFRIWVKINFLSPYTYHCFVSVIRSRLKR